MSSKIHHKQISVVAKSAVMTSVTGTLDETTLATITIPKDSLGPTGILRISYLFTVPLNSNVKYIRVRFGGTSFIYAQFTNTTTVSGQVDIYNRGITNSQVSYPTYNRFGIAAAVKSDGTVDTTLDKDITITAQLTNISDTIKLEAYIVEIL